MTDSFITYSRDATERNTEIWVWELAFTEMAFKSHLFENAVTSSGRLSSSLLCTHRALWPAAILKHPHNRKANPMFVINMEKTEREFTATKGTSFHVGVKVDNMSIR